MSENFSRFVVFLLAAQIFIMAAPPVSAQQALAPGSFKAYAADDAEARVSDFSGLPVPRYSSLRYDKVNGRAGPSRDYPVRWTYKRLGLPVVVIRETQDWRKVRDPLGDEVWVNKSQLAAERTAVTTIDGALRRTPESRAEPVASFAPGVVVSLGGCRGAWCRVEAQGRKGWVLRSELWGADDLPAPAR